MSQNHAHPHTQLPVANVKKAKQTGNPTEYRTFQLEKEMKANSKLDSVIFSSQDDTDPSQPIYITVILEIPTEQVMPYSPNQIQNPGLLRAIPIFGATARDITPTDSAQVMASGVAGSTSTKLAITLISGGKVPGGIGAFFKVADVQVAG